MGLISIKDLVSGASAILPFLRKHPLIASVAGLVLITLVLLCGQELRTVIFPSSNSKQAIAELRKEITTLHKQLEAKTQEITQLTTERNKVTAANKDLRAQINAERKAYQSMLETFTQALQHKDLQAHITAEREAYRSLLEPHTQALTRLTAELGKMAVAPNEPPPHRVAACRHTDTIDPLKVRQAQMQLKALGFLPGPIDGLYGPLTHAALSRYQAAQAMLPLLDPKPDAQTLAHAHTAAGVSTP